jgi:hypothetical protein
MEPSLSGRCARANVQAGLRRHTPNQHSNDERRKDVAELEHELEHNGDIRLGDERLRPTSTARLYAQLHLDGRRSLAATADAVSTSPCSASTPPCHRVHDASRRASTASALAVRTASQLATDASTALAVDSPRAMAAIALRL